MKRLDTDWLQDVLEAIDDTNAALADRSKADFMADRVLQAAVSHYISVISEASRHIPDSYKNEFPTIRWRQIRDIGNRIRHGYFSLDLEILWNIYCSHLPALRQAILELLKKAGIDRS